VDGGQRCQRTRLHQPVPERLALEILHHDVRPLVRAAEVGHLDDVGVANLIDGAGFREKARDGLRVARHFGVQDLDGRLARDHLVLGEIDDAHPAFAQHLDDLVGADAGSLFQARAGLRRGSVPGA
jgi:hypothetical protein